MKRDFNTWFSSFRKTIVDYGCFVDFEKVYGNVEKLKVELNILNSLIGSRNIKEDFIELITRYPETLVCIPLLLAVRKNELICQDADRTIQYIFNTGKSKNKLLGDAEGYAYFMERTGLFDLLENHIVNNLVDYVTGVESGLDSNGRKNRVGHLMENLVESYISKAGFVNGISYFKELSLPQITDNWGVDMSAVSNHGKADKRFDFVIKTAEMIYGVEVNFYSSTGSKLNETALSYKTLAAEIDTIPGFTFVWFTDGGGWRGSRSNLEETFDVMEHIYNIKDLEEGIAERIFK